MPPAGVALLEFAPPGGGGRLRLIQQRGRIGFQLGRQVRGQRDQHLSPLISTLDLACEGQEVRQPLGGQCDGRQIRDAVGAGRDRR